jgi:hypothetical protein
LSQFPVDDIKVDEAVAHDYLSKLDAPRPVVSEQVLTAVGEKLHSSSQSSRKRHCRGRDLDPPWKQS